MQYINIKYMDMTKYQILRIYLSKANNAIVVKTIKRRKLMHDHIFYDRGEFAIDALESWIGVEKVPAASCYNHQLDHHHEIN